jgi:flagellar biosynthesis protein FlhG
MSCVRQQLWTVGGGKGGVGKSFLTASMGLTLAKMGKSVILVDADLGAGNLHTFLGIKTPGATIYDVLENRAADSDVVVATEHPLLKLVSCARGAYGTANPTARQKERMIEFLSHLVADHVLVDLGSGISFNVLDLFNITDAGIVITVPDPASLQSAYDFIKNALLRKIQQSFGSNYLVMRALMRFGSGDGTSALRTMMDFYDLLCTTDPQVAEKVSALVDTFHPLVLINLAASDQDQQVAEILQSTCKKFLNTDLRFCGLVVFDPCIKRAAQGMSLLNLDEEKSAAAAQIEDTVQRLINCARTKPETGSPLSVPSTPTIGLNDNLDFMGRQLHIQTEDMGYAGRFITTQVFCNGKVILSTKSEYPANLRSPDGPAHVADLMRNQHFGVIQDLEAKKTRILQPSPNR